jgi:hypothetical protein
MSNHSLFYDFLFGPYGLKTYVWQNTLAFSSWQQIFFASPIVYYIVLVGVAITIGMTVFTILQAIGSVVRGSSELLHEASHISRTGPNLFYRLGLRVISLMCWVVYVSVFISTLLPLSLSLTNHGIGFIEHADYFGAVLMGGAVALLAVALHLHVIFARLFALRPRVFGGDSEILEAEAVAGN